MKLIANTVPLFEQPAVRIFIAYDGFEAGQRAMRIFSHLARDHEGEFRFQPQPWRFDFLADPQLFEFARVDGARADVLVVSMVSRCDLPPAVKRWLRTCLQARRSQPGAIIGLFGREGELPEANSAALQFLKDEAMGSGFPLLAPARAAEATARLAGDPAGLWERLRGPSNFNCHWGINE